MLHVVTTDQTGKRADVFLAALTGSPRSRVAGSFKRGDVTINGMAAKPSRLLEVGDVISYEIEPARVLRALPEDIALDIVYEDDDLLVVNKPAGMVTHPAHGAVRGTLVNALMAHVGSGLPGEEIRAGLVHRLDRDTSGLLVVAKRDESLKALAGAMKARRIAREYLGLVCGIPENTQGKIEGAIGRDPRNRLRFAISSDGKPAITHYEIRERFPKHAELTFRLETGRTHQIRVHLAAAGYPVLNDPLYGKKEARFELLGQALHAWRLAFRHPRTGEEMAFELEPPPAYMDAARLLRPSPFDCGALRRAQDDISSG